MCATVLPAQVADSASVAREVDSLVQVARALTGQGDFDKALEVNAVAEKLALEKLGRESAAYGYACLNRGRVNYFKNDYPEAEKWYLEGIAVQKKALGKEHPDYAASLNGVANLYRTMSNYEKAEPLYIEAKTIREKVLGKEHPDYAASLNNLANLYHDMGNYKKAESLFDEAISIRGKTLGMEHPSYANSLTNLAILYTTMGNYEKAESLLVKAVTIREKTLGKEHPDYAHSLNSLAIVYQELANFEKAEPLFVETKAILEKTLGKEHPEYAQSLNNLAGTYHAIGNYEKAEPLFNEAMAIREKIFGKEHPDYAASLTNLATLRHALGNYGNAVPLLIEAIAILEKVIGKEHPDYAQNLNTLSAMYHELGNYEKAEPLFIEVKTILEKTLGKEHPDYAASLNNLAMLYLDMNNYEKTELLLAEAKAIREKALGKEHPDYASSLSNLALLYLDMGNYEKAEPLFIEAKTIREKTFGKTHPEYAHSLNSLAKLYRHAGDLNKTEPLIAELSFLDQSLLARAVHHLSERELSTYLKPFSAKQNLALSFVQVSGSKKSASTCFDNTLFYKGFLLSAAGQIKRLARSDSLATQKFNLLKSYERRLYALYVLPSAERDSARVNELERKANEIEKDLSRTVAGFGEATRQVKGQEVQQCLKADEAVVEFVHFRYYTKDPTDCTLYAALLLRPEDIQPVFIPLFEAKQLDSLLRGGDIAGKANDLYATRGVSPVSRKNTFTKDLYALVWKPLSESLKDVKTVYFSPSGRLSQLNLAAIPVAKGQTLADRHHLVQLGSTRQLVVPAVVKIKNNEAALFGGIQYELDSTAVKLANFDLKVNELVASRGELSFSQTDSTLRGGIWNYLPGTEKEVAAVEKILKSAGFLTETRTEHAATEEAFKSIGNSHGVTSSHPVTGSPRVLHLATHGFFFPDPEKTSAMFETSPTFDATEPVFKLSDHPMIRSGLILAGGNAAWQGAITMEGMEDGILTAYEISQMNLSNTELVVLSACETGLGDIQGNEGVYGLQRAFKIAGAKYLIMSLWQVPDKQTSLLMTTFYKKWLEENMAIPEAFRAAQKELREAGLDPYQWAGFVLVE